MANFRSFVITDGDEEISVIVEYSADVCKGDYWTPPVSEMTIEKVEPEGDWPEGLSQEEFDRVCKRALDRHTEEAWDDLQMYYENEDRRGYEEDF
jgi:hypothetical protein